MVSLKSAKLVNYSSFIISMFLNNEVVVVNRKRIYNYVLVWKKIIIRYDETYRVQSEE